MSKFREHTRSIAFSIQLSEPQINAILLSRHNRQDEILEAQMHRATLSALDKKGLMKPRSLELTEEGYTLSSLLVLAGFEV